MRSPWIRIVGPLILFALSQIANFTWPRMTAATGAEPGGIGFEIIRVAAQGSTWLAVAFVAIRLLDLLLWKGIIVRRTGVPATRLLTDLVNGIILVSALAGVIAFVLDKPVTGLVATSGVAVAVVGFALKSMISDLFSGIAITLERPFNIGDWIEITGGIVGQVKNVSWRATALMQQNGISVVVPNGRLSEMVLKVYDRPAKPWRDEIEITLGYEISAHQAERILLSAATDVPEIMAQAKRPDVKIAEFGTTGVKWRLRYWVPDYPKRGSIRYAVQRNILRNMHFAGVEAPPQRIEAFVTQPSISAGSGGTKAFLSRVSLFKMLDETEMAELAANVEFRLILAGTSLVRAGDAGDSLFVIKEGLCDVLIPGTDGDRSVAHLKPGAFFGEMSLLTGAPRSATVRASTDSMVIEINKGAIQPILARRDVLVEAMSRVLAERQMQNDRSQIETAAANDSQSARQSLSQQLLGRMRSFFGLGVAA
jgi:small-conductance mechanosensitive channel/CRP-like cAMP-binding protein